MVDEQSYTKLWWAQAGRVEGKGKAYFLFGPVGVKINVLSSSSVFGVCESFGSSGFDLTLGNASIVPSVLLEH